MPATYNIAAFRTTAALPGISDLGKSYCNCVHIELALKQAAPPGKWGHDIAAMLERITAHTPATTGQLKSLAAQFRNVVGKLWSQSKSGNPEKVAHHNYPAIRYLRHSSDWNVDASVDADVQRLNSTLEMLRYHLQKNTAVPL